MLIRPYQSTDRDAIVQLWTDCQLIVPHNNPDRDILRKLQVNPEWFLVGIVNELIIASCMAGYEGHRGWINYLAIAPSHQGRGYARQIMQHAETLLQTAGCPKINLQIRSSNQSVIELYTKLGYTIDPVTSMGKRLIPDQ